MWGWQIAFDRPAWLALLILLPALWWFSYKSLSGLGKWRRALALGLRTIVCLALVLALAEVQVRRTSEKMTTIFVVDQSESVSPAKRQAALNYVISEVARHRNAQREDRAGLIVFGREARVEIPPFEDDIPALGSIESSLELRTDASDLASALKLARATFPEDAAKRIVLVTDGNETSGDARSVARALVADGIGIDVVAIPTGVAGDVAVDKLVLPNDSRVGQKYQALVLLRNDTAATTENPEGTVRGKIRLLRRSGESEELLAEQPVELDAGKNAFPFQIEIDQPGVFTYEAEFTPYDQAEDGVSQNNRVTAFTHVRGKGRILMIENAADPGQFDLLIDRLRNENLEVTLQATDNLFTNLAELQSYDTVILADVPRTGGDEADDLSSFTDDQISMLVRNTEQMGCGLVMLGGPDSFGAGGWANTELEKAMPVDFTIKNSKIQAVGALVLMMHASELAQGNHWQKVVGREAIKTLGPMDYCGLIHWDFTGDTWLWGKTQGGLIRVDQNRDKMTGLLDRMEPGDMPQFDPAMRMSLASFNRVNASVKHMIVISDGDPAEPTQATIQAYIDGKIQVTTVAVGTHGAAGSNTLQKIANATGGKYYVVNNPKALPRIYQREARKVSRPLIYEKAAGITPVKVGAHEILAGLDTQFDPITGFVMTTVKESPLVEVALVSPEPPDPANATLLATWNYGIGRSVVFTSDAGRLWTNSWTSQPYYDKLFSQMIRWSMRPVNEENKFLVDTDVRDGKGRIVVTALNQQDDFENFIDFGAVVVDPELKSRNLNLRQTAPGKYEGEFDADMAGTFIVSAVPGVGQAPVLAGINVPYSEEFRFRETNLALIESLASLQPKGGEPGRAIVGDLSREGMDELLQVDTFRHTLARANSSQDAWWWALTLAAGIFFLDVFFRRVTVGLEWTAAIWKKLRERFGSAAPSAETAGRMDRLRSRKESIAQSIDERRAATRFEPQAPAEGNGNGRGAGGDKRTDEEIRRSLDEASAPAVRPETRRAPQTNVSPDEEKTYTSRLLDAKKRARDKKDTE
ncbi:MAG TPA: VWA domain-containing protein [Pirellulaceae bacterium]|jgi:uncharacterized membrane protein/Mg-chelatase subunit ChlD|nr:VWA domain-containing protein [Pirellulaceae bacterium]